MFGKEGGNKNTNAYKLTWMQLKQTLRHVPRKTKTKIDQKRKPSVQQIGLQSKHKKAILGKVDTSHQMRINE